MLSDFAWPSLQKIGYVSFMYDLVAAAEIRDRETGLVSRPFLWFQSRQIFHETHETEANPIFLLFSPFYSYVSQEYHCKT